MFTLQGTEYFFFLLTYIWKNYSCGVLSLLGLPMGMLPLANTKKQPLGKTSQL